MFCIPTHFFYQDATIVSAFEKWKTRKKYLFEWIKTITGENESLINVVSNERGLNCL